MPKTIDTGLVVQINGSDDRHKRRKVKPDKGWQKTVKALLALNAKRRRSDSDDVEDRRIGATEDRVLTPPVMNFKRRDDDDTDTDDDDDRGDDFTWDDRGGFRGRGRDDDEDRVLTPPPLFNAKKRK